MHGHCEHTTVMEIPRQGWILTFMAHLLREVPLAPPGPLQQEAERLHGVFGHWDPVEVAEAEWSLLPLTADLTAPAV